LFNHLVEGPLRDPASLNKPSTAPLPDALRMGEIPGVGVHWGLYNLIDAPAVREAQKQIYALYTEGKIAPLVSERVPIREAPAAMTRVASRGTVGKVVLVP